VDAVLRTLADRLGQTIAARWAETAVVRSAVDPAAYVELFRQVGLPLATTLLTELELHGSFEIVPFGEPSDEDEGEDEDSASDLVRGLRGPGWAGRDAVTRGLHLLPPEALFETYRSQRHAAMRQGSLGAFWVFAAPRSYLWTSAFAFDGRRAGDGPLPIVPFHEDDIHEQLAVQHADGSLRHARATLEAWAAWLVDEICATVSRLEADGCQTVRAGSPPRPAVELDLASMLAEVDAGKRWTSWERASQTALRRGSVAMARQVLDQVGTLVTRPNVATWKLPSALDLLYRLPTEGPRSRRAAVLSAWGPLRPDTPATRVAFDTLVGLADSADSAPVDVFEALRLPAWADRGPADRDEVRWARALLWALGRPRPEHLLEAAELVMTGQPRDVAETCWLRIEAFARDSDVL
jgi:hypothetical protein